eukprot:gene3954-14033_t
MDDLFSANKLAKLMQELGADSTSDESTFRLLVQQCSIDERAVAEVLGLMVRTQAQWNYSMVVDVLRETNPGLSWAGVAQQLDHEGFILPDQQAFAHLCGSYQRGAGEQLPLSALVGRAWQNTAGQLSLLSLAISAPHDLFSFEKSGRMLPLEGLENIIGGQPAAGSPILPWLCLDLLEALCYLSDAGHIVAVRQLLEFPVKNCPEVLLIGMASIPTEWSLLQREVYAALLPLYLSKESNGSAVLQKLWNTNEDLILGAMVEFFSQDHANIARILDICQELQVLGVVLDSTPYPFSLELASWASSRECLNLEKWLSKRLADNLVFTQAALRYLVAKTQVGVDGLPLLSKVPLSQDTLRIYLRLLQQSLGGGPAALPGELGQELVKVQQQSVKMYPGLAPMVTQGSEAFASDVEEEANSYFQKIYSEQKPIEEVVQMLKQFKSSQSAREQEVFACMIHNLFDEYRFFPRYPDKELHITAILFGALVQHQLVSSITLGIALRYVLDALKKPPGSKMCTFGTDALRQFVGSIQQWPQFCQHLLQVPHLREQDPELYAHVEAAVLEAQNAQAASGESINTADSMAAGGPVGQPAGLPFLGMGPISPPAMGVEQRQSLGFAIESLDPPGSGAHGGAPTPLSSGALPGINLGTSINTPAQDNSMGSHTFGQLIGSPTRAAAPASEQPSKSQPPGPPGQVGQQDIAAASAAAASGGPALGAGLSPHGRMPTQTGAGAVDIMSSLADGDDALDKDGSISLAAQVAAASLMPSTAKEAPSLASLVNTESLETAAEKYKDFKEPPEQVQDRIAFAMNNVTMNNVEQKALEIKERTVPEYIPWFANYMVVKRAAQEANFHNLYMLLCDKMECKELTRLLIKTTHYFVKILLYSERTIKESNDRALLKNLGVWLGLLTFAKNKPVLWKELELKHILVEAYQRGRLIAVLPFLQKLLECCKDSKVFRPTNPMISGILGLLAELHSIKGLKINNVFSIELVFKAFNITHADVKPTDHLRHLPRDRLQNPDWGVEALPEEHPPPAAADSEQDAKAGQAGQQGGAAGAPGMHGQGMNASAAPPSSLVGLMQAAAAAAAASRTTLPPTAVHQLLPPSDATANAVKATSILGNTPLGALLEGTAGTGNQAQGQGAEPTPGVLPGQPGGPPALEVGAGLIAQLHNYVVINPSLSAIAERLQLKRHVPSAVDRAIFEILSPVVERSVTIACYTTVELLLKDFAMDPDEGRMRKAAHLMVSSLAGSLALVTCKDPLRVSLTNSLRTLLQAGSANISDASVLESVVSLVVSDNLDLGCTVIERAATEKAVRDVDKLLLEPYEQRAKARAQGKQFADNAPFHGRFPASLPDSLQPRPGVVIGPQLRVYEDFQRIPRTTTAASLAAQPQQQQQGAAGAMQQRAAPFQGGAEAEKVETPAMSAQLEKYMVWQNRADNMISAKEGQQQGPGADQSDLQVLLQELNETAIAPGAENAEDSISFLSRRLLKHLYEGSTKLHASFYIACLEMLAQLPGGKRVPVDLMQLFAVAEDERKYNREIGEMMLRARLFSLPELDSYLAKVLTATRNPSAIEFLMNLIKVFILRDQVLAYHDMYSSIEVLGKLSARIPGSDAVTQLVEQARKSGAAALVANRRPSEIAGLMRDKADPNGLREQAISLFEEWLRVLNTAVEDKQVLGNFLVSVRNAGVLKMDETTDRFLRLLMELSVNHALSSADAAAAQQAATGRPADASAPMSFMAVDALVCLISTITIHGGSEAFLSRTLNIIVGMVKRDADERSLTFNARPYTRLLAGLICELGQAEPAEGNKNRYLQAIGLALYDLQPISVPGFAFSWVELIAHRHLMPKLLASPQTQGWALFEALLVGLLKFLEPYLRSADLADSIRQLYKGSLRLLLVLLHDIPEFLCEHHFTLCDVIPPSCIQMRNLILSAFPRNMRLPDPFTPNLKVDLLPEISQPPRVLPEPERLLQEPLKAQVDQFLHSRTPPTFPQELVQRMSVSASDPKAAAALSSVPAINALVLYVGATVKNVSSPMNAAAMELYIRMATELDSEARYTLLNAFANQLRYPNSHTHYFSCALLTMFAEIKSEVIKEQITRVLLERLIVNRPHPWGLLITFIELIKNPRYNFWSHEFTRCAPDIERLFKSVANSCMGPPKADEEGASNTATANITGGGNAVLPKETAFARHAALARGPSSCQLQIQPDPSYLDLPVLIDADFSRPSLRSFQNRIGSICSSHSYKNLLSNPRLLISLSSWQQGNS